MRLVLRDANQADWSGAIHDETMIARDLQQMGMTRADALRAAYEHLKRTRRAGIKPGGCVAVLRRHGDNGGPA